MPHFMLFGGGFTACAAVYAAFLANLSLLVPLPVTNVGQITWNTNYRLLLLAKSKRSKQETTHKKLQNEIVLPGRSCFFCWFGLLRRFAQTAASAPTWAMTCLMALLEAMAVRVTGRSTRKER